MQSVLVVRVVRRGVITLKKMETERTHANGCYGLRTRNDLAGNNSCSTREQNSLFIFQIAHLQPTQLPTPSFTRTNNQVIRVRGGAGSATINESNIFLRLVVILVNYIINAWKRVFHTAYAFSASKLRLERQLLTLLMLPAIQVTHFHVPHTCQLNIMSGRSKQLQQPLEKVAVVGASWRESKPKQSRK